MRLVLLTDQRGLPLGYTIVPANEKEYEPLTDLLTGTPAGLAVRIAQRILAPLNIPIVFGAPIGHTARPLLTLPLGATARLTAEGQGTLEFPEPTVTV